MAAGSHAASAAAEPWEYEVVTILVVLGTSLLAFGLESVHHHSQ